MQFNVLMTLDLDKDCDDKRNDVYEALKEEGFEKVEGVSTTWKHLLEARMEREALASARKKVKKAVFAASVDVNFVIQAGNAQSESEHFSYLDVLKRLSMKR